jgi:hypothetical protein
VSRVDEIRLDEFSVLELEELSNRVAEHLVIAKQGRTKKVREEMEELAEREGLSLDEVIRTALAGAWVSPNGKLLPEFIQPWKGWRVEIQNMSRQLKLPRG